MRHAPPKIEWILVKLLKVKWPLLAVVVIALYLLSALPFSFAYETCVDSEAPYNFQDYIYFSLTTQLSIGDGDLTFKNVKRATAIKIVQAIYSLFYFAIASALVVFKLLRTPRKVIRFDQHPVFYPREGVLKFRVYNHSRFMITDIRYNCYLRRRSRLESGNKIFTLQDVSVDIGSIPVMKPMDPFIVKTITPTEEREIEFTPGMFREADEFILKISGNVYELNDYVVHMKTYYRHDFGCGEFMFIDPHGDGVENWELFEWNNWNYYIPISATECKKCKFYDQCRISSKAPQVKV